MKNDYAIILAGGKGLRMGGTVAKQFLPIGGLPILMHTIRRFREYSESLNIILVLPREQHDYWRELCQTYGFDEQYEVAEGGATRFHSIQNGLRLVPDDEGSAVPVVPVVETVRQLLRDVEGDTRASVTVPRDDYRLVQTPQAFDIQLHKRAYRQPFCEAFTDDASVVEAMGHSITLVEGNRENIKITTPFDIVVGEALVRFAGEK